MLDVARAVPPAQDARVAGEPATVANGETAALEARHEDLLSTLSEVLAESGRRERLAKELKPAGAHDDEFARFAREVTPFLDGFDQIVAMAREHEGNEEIGGWLKAVESLYERLIRNFESFDLKVIDCVGQEVDFNMHDVIEYRRTKDHPHNTVVDVIRKGIVFRGRILRDAKVVVACNEDEKT